MRWSSWWWLAAAACTPRSFDVRAPPHGFGPTETSTGTGETGETSSTGSTPGTTPSSGTSTSSTSSSTTSSTSTDGSIPEGIDVSRWQGEVDWDLVSGSGIAFALVKATEGTYYTSPTFSEQYEGSADAGLIRGAYHFAIPDDSSGAAQAIYFFEHGGGWSADGQTLPGVLDIEWNPYDGNDCYDLSRGEMEDWILDFSETYLELTGRHPTIYTSASWWSLCVDSDLFGATNPLWVAHYGVAQPNLPVGWSDFDFWQYTSTGEVPGVLGDCDVNEWNGTWRTLRDFAASP